MKRREQSVVTTFAIGNVLDFISDNEEINYREEVQHLVEWCSEMLVLNTNKLTNQGDHHEW